MTLRQIFAGIWKVVKWGLLVLGLIGLGIIIRSQGVLTGRPQIIYVPAVTGQASAQTAAEPGKSQTAADQNAGTVTVQNPTPAEIQKLGTDAPKGLNLKTMFTSLGNISPVKPFEWVWMPIQEHVSDHNQWPSVDIWAKLAQRPDTWLVVDASATGNGNGYCYHCVAIYYIADGVPQRDVFLKDGQYFVLDGSVSYEEVLEFAKSIALHTGSSNISVINVCLADRKS